MIQKLIKIGSSAAVVIPKKSLKELGFRIGDEIRVDIDLVEQTVLVESAKKPSRQLTKWVDDFTERYKKDFKLLAKR